MTTPDTPYTREEMYLNAAATGDSSGIPATPYTRKEQYLNAIATGNTDGLPETPFTREEMYLDAIANNGGGGGGGGGTFSEEWDFTSATPLVGKNYGITLTASGMDYGENGAIFNGSSDVIRMGETLYTWAIGQIVIEADVYSSALKSSANRRLFADSNGNGLVWHSASQLWGVYAGSAGWEDSEENNPDIFSGHTAKVVVDKDRKWSVYKDNTLLMKTQNPVSIGALTLGSSSSQSSFYEAVISSFRISASLR